MAKKEERFEIKSNMDRFIVLKKSSYNFVTKI